MDQPQSEPLQPPTGPQTGGPEGLAPQPADAGRAILASPVAADRENEANLGAEAPIESAGGHAGRVIAIANQKGGVGKSTTAVNLGACLAEAGRRILVVDLDPQGNASTGLGIDHGARKASAYEVLIANLQLQEAMVPTSVEGLWAVPSTIDLAGAEIELVTQFNRESRLARALDGVRDSFDFVLLDCPPSLGLLTVNALTAADELIVPIQCEYYALEGLGQLLKNVRLVQQNVNPSLRLTGIVMTMFDGRTKLAEQVVQEVRAYFGSRVYESVIPRSIRLAEAPGFGQPITRYDPGSRGAKAYQALAQELLTKPALDGLDDIGFERVTEGRPITVAPEQPVRPVESTVPRGTGGPPQEATPAEAEESASSGTGATPGAEVEGADDDLEVDVDGASLPGEVAEGDGNRRAPKESTGEVVTRGEPGTGGRSARGKRDDLGVLPPADGFQAVEEGPHSEDGPHLESGTASEESQPSSQSPSSKALPHLSDGVVRGMGQVDEPILDAVPADEPAPVHQEEPRRRRRWPFGKGGQP